MITHMRYVTLPEGQHYVAQCLNVDVSSFGESLEETTAQMKKAA